MKAAMTIGAGRAVCINSCQRHMAEEAILTEKPVLEILMNCVCYDPPAGKICSILWKPLLFAII